MNQNFIQIQDKRAKLAHFIFIYKGDYKMKLLTKELEKKFHLVVDKLRFLGYYKTVMIIITSCK